MDSLHTFIPVIHARDANTKNNKATDGALSLATSEKGHVFCTVYRQGLKGQTDKLHQQTMLNVKKNPWK